MNHEKLKEIQEALPAHVTLVAVSKTRTKEEIDEAYAAGCTVFGENKVQEIVRKHDPRYHWHMIGHLQRNKVRQVLPLIYSALSQLWTIHCLSSHAKDFFQ